MKHKQNQGGMDEKSIKVSRIESELRIKARALRRMKAYGHSALSNPEDCDRAVGKLAHTPKACSCVKCGNPRKFLTGLDRETHAEHISRLREHDVD